ncbi:MAG: hypothetical protein QXL78_06570 [Methanocellales archaeon]
MCRCLECKWFIKSSLSCTAPGYKSKPQLTPKRVWRTRTCRYFSPKLYCIAGRRFLEWMRDNLPGIGFEDWSQPCRLYAEIKLRDLGYRVNEKQIRSYIAQYPEFNIRPQDYRLLNRDSQFQICWVDVRYAEQMENGYYSLDPKKFRDFLFISEDSKLPTYIVVYAAGDFNRFWWAKLDRAKGPELFCQAGNSFPAEINKLI